MHQARLVGKKIRLFISMILIVLVSWSGSWAGVAKCQPDPGEDLIRCNEICDPGRITQNTLVCGGTVGTSPSCNIEVDSNVHLRFINRDKDYNSLDCLDVGDLTITGDPTSSLRIQYTKLNSGNNIEIKDFGKLIKVDDQSKLSASANIDISSPSNSACLNNDCIVCDHDSKLWAKNISTTSNDSDSNIVLKACVIEAVGIVAPPEQDISIQSSGDNSRILLQGSGGCTLEAERIGINANGEGSLVEVRDCEVIGDFMITTVNSSQIKVRNSDFSDGRVTINGAGYTYVKENEF